MKNVHVIGHKGMVGSELVGRGCLPLECDITNPYEIKKALKENSPTTIILCAAETNVEWCEKNPMFAMRTNVTGVSNLVDVFKGRLIYISTDHVFDGKKFLGLGYSEKHSPNPLNVYGQTKFAGEFVAGLGWPDTRIIRTSKLFNRKSLFDKFGSNTPYIFSGVLKRSYLHVQHFVDGLEFVLDNWQKMPKVLNVSGTDILSEYMFMYKAAVIFDVVEAVDSPRNTKLSGATPRPIRGGLNVGLAKHLGVPLYSAFDGLELL